MRTSLFGFPMMLLACLGMALSGATSPAEASAHSKNREGNRLYQDKNYPEALKKYTEAQLEAPDSPQLHYNLGNVFFRQGEIDKAREEYRRAMAAADSSLDPKAVYNLGNTFFQQKDYSSAVEAYRRTLKLSPKDMDAKRNLELALLRMKQQKQKQPPSSQDSKKNQQKQQNGPSNPSGSQDKQNPQGGQDRKDQQPQGAQEKREKGGLTKDEAERILGALQEDEKENLKHRLESQKEKPRDVEKDW